MPPCDPFRHRCTVLAFVLVALCGLRVLAQAPAAADVAPLPDESAVSRRIDLNTRRLKDIEQFDNQLRQRLAAFPKTSQEDLNKMAAQNRALQLRLTALQNALNDFKTMNALGTSAIPDLDMMLAEAEKERDLLVKRQTDALGDGAATNNSKGWRHLVRRPDLTPIGIVLVRNRVVPKMEPFFQARTGTMKDPLTGKDKAAAQISRVHDGEAAANAIKSGGLLDSMLAKADPKRNCVLFFVCADSIAAYHSVSQAVAKHGFAYSWDTAKDEDTIVYLEGLQSRSPTNIGLEVFNPNTQ